MKQFQNQSIFRDESIQDGSFKPRIREDKCPTTGIGDMWNEVGRFCLTYEATTCDLYPQRRWCRPKSCNVAPLHPASLATYVPEKGRWWNGLVDGHISFHYRPNFMLIPENAASNKFGIKSNGFRNSRSIVNMTLDYMKKVCKLKKKSIKLIIIISMDSFSQWNSKAVSVRLL